jgi:hypothetical protein
MSKRTLFLLVVLSVLVSGCRSERYTTALEAYERARPVMRLWHRDAVVLDIGSGWAERSDWGVRADGTARLWVFTIASASALKKTEVWLKDGRVARVGIQDVPGGQEPYFPTDTNHGPPPTLQVAEMIDTDEAAVIALQAGATMSDTLYYIEIERGYSERTDTYDPPAWELTYGTDPHDFAQQQVVLIDVLTGEVLRNDFAPQGVPAMRSRR